MFSFWIDFNARRLLETQRLWIVAMTGVLRMTMPGRCGGERIPPCPACDSPMERVTPAAGGQAYRRCPRCGLIGLDALAAPDRRRPAVPDDAVAS